MSNSQSFFEGRKPGRSFTDPQRALGEEILARSDQNVLADRAKCVAVLRKADELMAEENPSGETEEGRRRALELACGRCGVHLDEYDQICDHDEEISSLHALVMEAARLRAEREPNPPPPDTH